MDFNRDYYSKRYNDKDNEIYESEVGNVEKASDELLIVAVRSYPHLYDSSLKEFKDVQLKENSWNEVAKIMNMSIATCQNRWVRLRDRFTKENRLREKETRSGSGATRRHAFPLHNNLLFLENYIKRRKSYTKRIKNKSNTYLEHSRATLIDNLQKRIAIQPCQQLPWNFNDLTSDKSVVLFGLMVATELDRIPEPEKSRRKQAISDILWKPLT